MLKFEIQWKTAIWSYRMWKFYRNPPTGGRWRIVFSPLWTSRKKCSLQWKSPQFAMRQIFHTGICLRGNGYRLSRSLWILTCAICVSSKLWRTYWTDANASSTPKSCGLCSTDYTNTLRNSRRNTFSPRWLNGKPISKLTTTLCDIAKISPVFTIGDVCCEGPLHATRVTFKIHIQ
jgi:hypothetical protein